jgi:hypothetical protein
MALFSTNQQIPATRPHRNSESREREKKVRILMSPAATAISSFCQDRRTFFVF